MVDELAASGELERLLNAALASPRTLEFTDRVLASEETQHALRQVASSPELRDAMRKQTAGLAEEVVGGVRASAVRLDGRVEHAVSRGERVGPSAFAGIATRALALATDAIVTTAMFMGVVGVVAIVASLVGGSGLSGSSAPCSRSAGSSPPARTSCSSGAPPGTRLGCG